MTIIRLKGSGKDDQVAIKQAAQQAGPGGRLELEGSFALAQNVVLTQPLFVTGLGIAHIKRQEPWNGNLLEFHNAFSVVVEGLTIDDALVGATAQPINATMALRFFQCKDSLVRDVTVKNGLSIPILAETPDGFTVDHCTVEDARGVGFLNAGVGGHGIAVNGLFAKDGTSPRARNVRIINCTTRRCWRGGLYLNSVDGGILEGNTLDDDVPQAATDAGIERGGMIGIQGGCRNIAIVGNTLLGRKRTGSFDANAKGGSQGIEVDVTDLNKPGQQPAHAITITGNTICEQDYAGITIYVDPGTPVANQSFWGSITGNVLIDNNQRQNKFYGAIWIAERVNDFSIVGNTIKQTLNPGIKLGGKNARHTVGPNQGTLVVVP